MPCVYVAENHEFYKGSVDEGPEKRRSAFPGKRIVVINCVLFIGATLWTDYEIMGGRTLPCAMLVIA
jgi:hypothetical protein